ncbi:lycopene beta-cyclase CrtY [Lichenihabitans sp. Uapishka_5]|uniref:lycopene beta-cyclase CrtY n=1 Tax=Lichenihabitans sp. Uapishka_5 TaxID=3037302 RepID=UPI0029E808C4|nr:lycopene beta-cyclase CrtY [Lichenihabitans sp. Uapishka_5]MDX7953773.1 lycopene beta-cyclase CrtY [Lichenihabitans sp. Uapishka_5]
MTAAPDWDLILAGGGLANGLIAFRLRQLRPELRVLLVEAGRDLGGNHTWSSHAGDLSPSQQAWSAPFVTSRWPHYDVRFPGHMRRVELGYQSVTSERFAAVLREAGIAMRLNAPVAAVTPTRLRLGDGTELRAGAVVDGRGFAPTPHLRLAYQKFFGRDLRLAAPHGLTGPIVMDATVAQHDGYRFIYVLPFEPDRVLVEDTYYADSPVLDAGTLRARVDRYVAEQGWTVLRVLREEDGVLPITLTGDVDAAWAEAPDQPRAGLRAGLFHPTTGYSFAEAVRLADHIAALPGLDAPALAAAIERHARRRWRAQRFFRALNRMLFQAGRPDERWTMMRRFYRFPEALITRFYAGDLAATDKIRLLSGKPPVPVLPALRALMDHTT